MKIAVIGKGMIGGTLGRLWARQGYEVMWGVREPQSGAMRSLLAKAGPTARADTVRAAAAWGDVLLFAVPWGVAKEVLDEAGALTGKVLIDATNPLSEPAPEAPSAAEQIARWAEGARVVKAFNSTSFANMENPEFGSERADNFMASDDADAKAVVRELSEAIGFPVVDAGPLANAALLESLAALWIQFAYALGHGRDIAWKLMRR